MTAAATPVVFISHTVRDLRDRALAHAVADGLRERGAQVWIAPGSVASGHEWEPAIVQAVMCDCTHFLVILSAASIRAEMVEREICLARSRKDSDPQFSILTLETGELPSHSHAAYLSRLQRVPFHESTATQVEAVASAIGVGNPVPSRFRSLVDDRRTGFVGRDHVFAAIERFRAENDRGYFAIVGDPGVGKSAIIAELTGRTGCVVHFNERSKNVTTAAQFLDSVLGQLLTRYTPGSPRRADATQDGSYLGEVLDDISEQLAEGQQLVIAVDALDEAELPSPASGANILYLPSMLPRGVFVVVAHRHMPTLPLMVEAPLVRLDLTADSAAGRDDARAYVAAALARPEVRDWVVRQELTDTEVVELMVSKSAANFMYLRYVVADIAAGRYDDRSLRTLPDRLEGYYEDHWRRMGMTGPLPATKIRILFVICELRRPVSRELLTALASTSEMPTDAVTIQETLDQWAAFLHRSRDDGVTFYRVYHETFREFLHRKEGVQAAGLTLKGINADIADALWHDVFPNDER